AADILMKMGPPAEPTLNFAKQQIINCDLPDNKEKEKLILAKKAQLEKEFEGDSGFNGFGGMLMSGIISSFLPKIQDAIVKNRPKLIQYFKGEISLDFQPIPENETPKQ